MTARRRAPQGLAAKVEAAVATASALVVLGVIGFLVRDGLTHRSPPRLEVAEARFDADARRLDFAIANAGGAAAAGVVVSAILRDPGGGVLERRSLTFEHISPGSRATGAFLLDAPAEIVVDGYVDP